MARPLPHPPERLAASHTLQPLRQGLGWRLRRARTSAMVRRPGDCMSLFNKKTIARAQLLLSAAMISGLGHYPDWDADLRGPIARQGS